MTVWFTADTHFGHANILTFSRRPFADIREHDEALVANWNARVGRRDEVWHLGDFALGLDERALSRLTEARIVNTLARGSGQDTETKLGRR